MRLEDAAWLLNENVHEAVLEFLEARGSNVTDVRREGLIGATDTALLEIAQRESRVILTHDRDFGRLAFARSADFFGMVFLRPGHHRPEFVLSLLSAALSLDIDLEPPFVIVVQRRDDDIRIRIRQFRRE